MSKHDKSNLCYVFSNKTLSQALIDWQDITLKKKPELEEALAIAVAALPWLLVHMNQSDPVIMFTAIDLAEEISKWKDKQLTAFPHQQQRIEESCEFISDFFQSDVVRMMHKMTVDPQ